MYIYTQYICVVKQACRDESIVSLFFSPIATYIALYFYVLSTVKRKNQYTDFLCAHVCVFLTLSYIFFTCKAFLELEEREPSVSNVIENGVSSKDNVPLLKLEGITAYWDKVSSSLMNLLLHAVAD